jgi:hypothetical protein
MLTIFRRQCDARGSPSKFTRTGNRWMKKVLAPPRVMRKIRAVKDE